MPQPPGDLGLTTVTERLLPRDGEDCSPKTLRLGVRSRRLKVTGRIMLRVCEWAYETI